ncbi:MAG: adenylate/guanylate cyclase domain-containing protein [Roseiflexus sp.]
MALITLDLNGEHKTYPVEARGLRIGRALENDIVLNHAIVSRYHAEIFINGRDIWVRDTNSRNGVFVNRLRIKEEQLRDGDVVQIGPFELHFEERAAQNVVLDDSRYFPVASEASGVFAPELNIDLQEFFRIARRLNLIIDMGELLDAIVEEVLRLIPAQRALLLLKRANELVPRVIYPPLRQEVVISSTIVRKALEAGEVVLTRDARLEIGGTESIISANIRSALCAPLLAEHGAIGLIYLDSPGRDRFGLRERDLLAAIANQAAVTIERARLTEELRKQEASRQLFERFVSPSVAHDVASYFSEHGRLREPQELIVSVLFADVKGFSSLSERLSPRDVQDLLNEYLHEMTEVIFRHNGTLDKYIGDGIMAIFGAPQVNEYQDYRTTAIEAVDAALDMIEAHRRLIEKLDPSKAFDFRIGINTGPVYAGFFGTRQRLEYTVIGDTVNTAARLESRADLNSVLISEATRNAIGDAFVLQEMGDYQLKGKAQLVHTYKVIGRAPSRRSRAIGSMNPQ